MQLEYFDSPTQFYKRAEAYLWTHEAEHNLLLRLRESLIRYPERYQELPYLAIVKDKDEVVAVAMRTPPYPLVLSKVREAKALELIAQDLYQRYGELPSSSGLVNEIKAFAQVWQTLTGRPYQLTAQRRIYRLTQVQPIQKATGSLRAATEADRTLITQWYTAFELEALGTVAADLEQLIHNRLQQSSLYIWHDQKPVTLVGANGVPPQFGSIAPVYTPPEFRCRGYATTAVAEVSQKLLERGCGRCFLFTDLNNSTSNHIYQLIGYQPICDWHEYTFGNPQVRDVQLCRTPSP